MNYRAGLVLLLGMLAWSSNSVAGAFTIKRAEIGIVNEIYSVTAQVQYRLSPEARDALANGVVLAVDVEVEIKRHRKRLWDPLVGRVVRTYRLKRHELSDQYVVIDVTAERSRSFDSLDAALEALGQSDPIPVVDRPALEVGAKHYARVRARLDVEALPAPLRLLAYVRPAWHLSSGWHRWPFTA
jgi:hypothetical protein